MRVDSAIAIDVMFSFAKQARQRYHRALLRQRETRETMGL